MAVVSFDRRACGVLPPLRLRRSNRAVQNRLELVFSSSKTPWLVFPMCAVLALMGCASPGERIDREAQAYGLERRMVNGLRFKHITYRNQVVLGERQPLHVYLEGDGSPWLNRFSVAPDPTPRHAVALKMMAQDREPSVYLGRPCYHGEAFAAECHPDWWTSRRYGEQVVDSMEAALRRYLGTSRYFGLVFIGYSGGGTLAMLLAERFPETVGVVTVAGNLDLVLWAAHHDYSPLSGSLNPADRQPLNAEIAQLHFVGLEDRVVPAMLSASVAREQPSVRLAFMKGFDHVCCWADVWPDLLERVRRLVGRPDGN